MSRRRVRDTQPVDTLSRRHALGALLTAGTLPWVGGAALAAGNAKTPAPTCAGAAAAWGDRRWTSEFVRFSDPVEQFRQTFRIQRSGLAEDDILHWYHFIMFAVPPDRPTVPVVRWEGIEFSAHRRIGPDRYRLHGHNLSYPRDLATGAFVDSVVNPLTGRRVVVPPMRLVEDPGLIRSVEGTLTLDKPEATPRPDYRLIRREGNVVKIDIMRVPPATWPPPFIEASFEQTPAALYDDPKQLWLPTETSGGYVFPWPAWMRMGDAPGHMFAIWSGYKLRSVDQLPEEFRRRAEREDPELLAVDHSQFRRRFPGLPED